MEGKAPKAFGVSKAAAERISNHVRQEWDGIEVARMTPSGSTATEDLTTDYADSAKECGLPARIVKKRARCPRSF